MHSLVYDSHLGSSEFEHGRRIARLGFHLQFSYQTAELAVAPVVASRLHFSHKMRKCLPVVVMFSPPTVSESEEGEKHFHDRCDGLDHHGKSFHPRPDDGWLANPVTWGCLDADDRWLTRPTGHGGCSIGVPGEVGT